MRLKLSQVILYCLIGTLSFAQSAATFNGSLRGNSNVNGLNTTYQVGSTNNTIINLPTQKGVQHYPLDFDKIPYNRDTTLNYFEIDKIPDQTVISGGILQFYVKCDSITSGNKSYYIIPSDTTVGLMYLKSSIQNFQFEPRVKDTVDFYVDFYATNGIDTIKQKVLFKTYRPAYINNFAFGVDNGQEIPDPAAKEYQLITTINNPSDTGYFNGLKNRKTKSIAISAIDLYAENIGGNILMEISNNLDIKQLDIYAERLFIRDTLNFPQTNVNIYCKELYFEDISGRASSAINTTPKKPIDAFEFQQGITGSNSGNINIFASKIIDDNGGIRFRLIGGDGQNSTNAQAGSGGGGGRLFSNLDLTYKGDYLGGLAGKPSGISGTLAQNQKGNIGGFIKDSIDKRWIHPNYIRQILAYSDDAFYLGYGKEILPKLVFYDSLINSFYNSNDFFAIDNYTRSDEMQVDMELTTLGNRIQSGFDYFGNPPGWVPMLSFEFSQAAFESELKHAMQILYLNYFITNAADTLQKRIDGFSAMRDELKNQSNIDKANFNDLLSTVIPDVENRISQNQQDMDNIKHEIEEVTAKLALRAEHQLEDKRRENDKPSWEKIVGGVATVATFIPYPPLQAIGAGINTGLSLYNGIKKIDNFNLNNVQSIIGTGQAIYGAVQTAQGVYNSYNLPSNYNQTIGKWNEINTNWQNFFPVFQGTESISGIVTQVKKGQALYESLNSTVKTISGIYDNFLKVDDSELKAIKSDLLANDPELAQLNASIEITQQNGKKLVDEHNSTNDKIQTLASQIVGTSLAFDDVNSKVLNNVKVLDHRTVHYIQYLRQDALRRLKKYNYYMAKAYEFRTLQPYTGNLNITPILESVEAMANLSGNGILTSDQYRDLGALYRNQISQVAENIYTYYQSNAPSQTLKTTYIVPKSDIIELNKGNIIFFNPINKGLFRNEEENIRIIKLHIIRLKDSLPATTTLGSTANIDVKFEYPNESYIKSKGKVYYFNNYNLNTTSPLIWNTRYDKNNNGVLIDSKPSEATSSFLQSLLTNQGIPVNSNNLLMYSRPSAGAELLMSSSYYNSNGTGGLYIDSLLIEVEYDYNTKPTNISYLDIQAVPEWIVPQYLVSKADNNTMQDGQGDMIRSFSTSTSNIVKVKTDSKIGGYRFERWLDKFGRPILDADSTNPERSFKMDSARFNRVQYKWAGPKMSLPDTLYFSPTQTTQSLSIKNIGESYMYWLVDSVSSSAQINGNNVRNGYTDTTLSVSMQGALTDGKLGFIAFVAPFAENAIDTVWLKYQLNVIDNVNEQHSNSIIKIFPNPTSNQLNILIKSKTNSVLNLRILDINGMEIYLDKINTYKGEINKNIDVSKFAKGIYILQLQDNENTSSSKFIVQ
jgi:hypothetical protein